MESLPYVRHTIGKILNQRAKIATGIGILGAAVLAGFVFVKKRAIDSLNIFIWTIGIHFDAFKPIISVTFRVQNPSNETFSIASVVGLLMVNGSNVGNVSSFKKIDIPPVTETDYTVDIFLAIGGNTAELINMISKGSGISQKIEFVGNINANGILFPLTLEYKIV